MRRLQIVSRLSLFALFAFASSACSKPPKPGDDTKGAKAGKEDAGPKAEFDSGPAGPLGPLPAGPVAFVGGDPITMADFRAIYDLKLAKYADKRRPMTKRIDSRYRRSITERLVWNELMRREAEALGVSYDPAELEEMVTQDRLGARDWEKDKARRGESDESLRQLHEAQLRERAILEKEGALSFGPEDIDAEYERAKSSYDAEVDRLRLAQIVIEIGNGVTKEQAEAEAKQVYEAARAKGADFAQLAREHSDVVTRQLGGDMGISRIDRMDPHLSEVAATMKVGEISKPIESPAAFQIIKLLARWGPGPLPKDAIGDQLQAVLYNRKLQESRHALEKRLYAKYEVRTPMLDGLEPGPAKPGQIPAPAQNEE